MDNINYHKITREEFLKLNEDDIMFITNPGRMGDEDGIYFVIKENNHLTFYRVDGWMYGIGKEISLQDAFKQFPHWYYTWDHNRDKNYKGKYEYLYMGFGNGLSVDNRIYEEYKAYLDKLVEEYLKDKKDKDKLMYAAIFNTWKKAVINMAKDKELIIK